MINCLLIKISYNKRGLPVRSYRTINSYELTLGRGAECNVHLPDPRLSMHHAVIKRNDDGQPVIQAINGDLEQDGVLVSSVPLTHGQRIMVGPYELSVEPAPPDVDLAISLVLAHRLPDDFQDLKARTHQPLQNASRFKRRLSIALAALIAIVFLGLPLLQNLVPQLHAAMAELPFGFDRVWSPGRISPSHMHFGSQCFNCHQQPTQKVSDKACLSCHQDTAAHIANPDLQKKAFNAAHRFVGTTRCAECHEEHKAPHPIAKQDNGMCVKCHGNIKRIHPESSLANVHDFDADHPEFKLTFKNTGSQSTQRIPQSEKARLVENSGLKFPHSQHVGKVQGPNGIWDVREMACTSCHVPQGKEMRFNPISFKNNCSSCHADQLRVGAKELNLSVPHGNEESVFNMLKLNAPKQFTSYADTLKNNGCAYCHTVIENKAELKGKPVVNGKPSIEDQSGDKLPWRITPLSINDDWFSKAQFNHGAHRTQQCISCHKVEDSESSAEVAIPDRQSCLQCHSGKNPKHKRIASNCMSCHNFHQAHQTIVNPGAKISEQDVEVLLSNPQKTQ